MNEKALQRSQFIKVLGTGETLARLSVEHGSNVIIHFWSKVRKAEVSIPATELITLALSACRGQDEQGQSVVLIEDKPLEPESQSLTNTPAATRA